MEKKSKEIDESSVHKIVNGTTSFNITILKHVYTTKDAKVQFICDYNKLYPTSAGIVSAGDEFDTISDDILSRIPMPTATSRVSTITDFNGTQPGFTTASALSTTTNATEDTNQNSNNNDKNNDTTNDDDEVMHVDNPSILQLNDITQLSALLKKSFVTPWDKHLNDKEARQMNATLAKYATSQIKSKATDKAAAIAANEPSATPQIMSDLITKAVNKKTEQMQNKLTKLEQQLSRSTISKSVVNNNKNAKNDMRGEKKTRASTPNKLKTKQQNENKSSSKKKSTTSNAKPKSNRKAGDANNDTKRDNKKTIFRKQQDEFNREEEHYSTYERQQQQNAEQGIIASYGFIANPALTDKHNAAIALAAMPCWYYYSRPINEACHNLCSILKPPMNYRGLLCLSLSFIQKPKFMNSKMSEWTDRFRSDFYTRVFMAHCQTPVPQLFIRTDWTPPIHLINYGVRMRVERFIKDINSIFIKRSTRSNMLPFQRNLLTEMRQNKKFVVFSADKNLGPCIIARDEYVKHALNDHLLDPITYQRLTITNAQNKMGYIETRLESFLDKFGQHLAKMDIKYLKRTMNVKDPFAKFYITAKIHKTLWTTRPIVSISGSKLAGLGCWIDKILQPYARSIPSFIKSSYKLKHQLVNLPPLPSNARLFTADAVSMYTNIEIAHTLQVLRRIINQNQHLSTSYEQLAVIEALDLLIKNNVFQFGDTYWLQIDGTAMGVSPSCTYATLYFSEHENKLLSLYPEISFYRRYIDDLIGIWIPNSTNDYARWTSFQQDIDKCGKLRWNVSTREKSVNFLDLTITINSDHRIDTRLHEKVQNLHLYLPRNNSHSPGNLKGLVAGMIYRTMTLTSCPTIQKIEIRRLQTRLIGCGHPPKLLNTLIEHGC